MELSTTPASIDNYKLEDLKSLLADAGVSFPAHPRATIEALKLRLLLSNYGLLDKVAEDVEQVAKLRLHQIPLETLRRICGIVSVADEGVKPDLVFRIQSCILGVYRLLPVSVAPVRQEVPQGPAPDRTKRLLIAYVHFLFVSIPRFFIKHWMTILCIIISSMIIQRTWGVLQILLSLVTAYLPEGFTTWLTTQLGKGLDLWQWAAQELWKVMCSYCECPNHECVKVPVKNGQGPVLSGVI
jgi:hypothetical protein